MGDGHGRPSASPVRVEKEPSSKPWANIPVPLDNSGPDRPKVCLSRRAASYVPGLPPFANRGSFYYVATPLGGKNLQSTAKHPEKTHHNYFHGLFFPIALLADLWPISRGCRCPCLLSWWAFKSRFWPPSLFWAKRATCISAVLLSFRGEGQHSCGVVPFAGSGPEGGPRAFPAEEWAEMLSWM